MHKGKSFTAIIPARGGSKRLPGKNGLDLAGKPLISVCETEHNPLWSNMLPEDGSMDHFLREEHSMMLKHKSYAYVMSRTSSIDIDEAIDLEMAEFFMKKYQSSTKKDFED